MPAFFVRNERTYGPSCDRNNGEALRLDFLFQAILESKFDLMLTYNRECHISTLSIYTRVGVSTNDLVKT